MNVKTMLVAAALGLGAALAGTPVLAQGPYMGASFGSVDADEGVVFPVLITSGTVDGKDSGVKIYGGYAFSRNFAAELSIVDLGQMTYSGSFGGSTVTNGKVKTSGLNMSLVGIIPLSENFSLFAKGGLFAWESKASDITNGFPFSQIAEDVDISYGFGASFHFNRNFSVQVEWEQFDAVDQISLLSAGVNYRF